MLRLFSFFLSLGLANLLMAQTVIISQYIDPSTGTSPKVIELWNPSGIDIDMSSTNIVVLKGTNGGTPTADITIDTGTLKAGETLVVGTTDATGTTCHTYVYEPFTFNGDDALVVTLGGTTTDMFGYAGSDPGTHWSGSGVNTRDQNIQLKTGITTGDPDGWTDPSTRFETVTTDNTMTGFGVPTDGCPGTSDPTLTATPGNVFCAYTASAGGPSIAKEITLAGEDLGSDNATVTASSDYEIATTSGGTYGSTLSFTPSSEEINTTFFIRLKSGKSAGAYNGTLSVTHDSITTFNITLTGAATSGNDTIKVVSYNLLQYGGANSQVRNADYRSLLTEMNPDILTVCEINTGEPGFELFRDSVIGISSPHFKAGTFIDNSGGLSTATYYDSSKFTFISNTAITTALRDINEFKFIHNYALDTFRVYGVHLKSSSGTTNEDLRAAEVHQLRLITDALPSGSNFIVQGDFNMYDSDEPGYDSLTIIKSGVEGQFYDPVTMPVSSPWNHSSNSQYVTQSTRTRSFYGGATGGLDDRFDMMLYSKALGTTSDVYFLSNSFSAFGNDANHYDDSINHGSNSAVSDALADALHHCSDHLPVLSRFVFEDGGFPLPVSLVWFEGKVSESGGTELGWQTASEFNNKGFEIQRFDEAKGWVTLDFVDGKGTTNNISDYTFYDNDLLLQPVRYYRLKQIDLNGAYEFTKVIVIDRNLQFADFTVAPNPFNGYINVHFEESKRRNVQLELIDLSGRSIQSTDINWSTTDYKMQTNEIPAGIYLLKVTSGTYTEVIRVMKR